MKRIITILFFLSGILFMNAIIAEQNYRQPIFNLEFTIYGTGARSG